MNPDRITKASKASGRGAVVILSAVFMGGPGQASADTYQWNGGVSGAWFDPSNWNPAGVPAGVAAGPAPTGVISNNRLNVANGSANALVHDASLGNTSYGGSGIRGLVIGTSASKGGFRVTGGVFSTVGSTLQDVINSPSTASESFLIVSGGGFLSNHLLLGLNNATKNTLTLNAGSASIGTVDFNVQNGMATVNLDGGILETTAFRISTTTPGNSTNTFNFNGGTLKAGAPSPAFFPDLARTTAVVKSGGAVVDTNGFNITISEPLADGGGGLTKIGGGVLTLAGPAAYTGSTAIDAGTLELATSGTLGSTSGVRIAAGAAFDISTFPSYAWPVSSPLASAGGDLKGGSSIDLGSTPVTLDYLPFSLAGDGSHPALTVSSGSVVLNGPLVVNNLAAAPLGIGTYVLVAQADGSISGNPAFSGSVGGKGIQSGKACFIRINGGNLELVVQAPAATSASIDRDAGISSSSTYGDTLRYAVTVSPSSATGMIELRDGGVTGTLLGSATLTGGSAIITPQDTALAPGVHANLVARYSGDALHLPCESPPLAPAQSIARKALTIANAAALDKYYDGTTTASISGTLDGVENGDTVTLVAAGTFASANPGTNIAVTSTSVLAGASAASYTLSQPAGLVADILAASIWTGGSGGSGTNLATGANYSPAAVTNATYNAIFNGLDPVTTDLTVGSTIGGGVGTRGVFFGFAGNQVNPVTITAPSSSITARVDSLVVAQGAGAVTLGGALRIVLGGPNAPTSHRFINDSANSLILQTTTPWVPGGGGSYLRAIEFGGAGDIVMASSLDATIPSSISLTKTGPGTLTLSGSNNHSGGTTISGGKVVSTTSTALGTGAVANHGTLDLTAGAVTHTGLSSSLTGSGAVNVTLGTGSASTPLNGDYSNFTGTWNVGIGAPAGAGKVQMNGADNPAATIRVLENATLYTNTGIHSADLELHGGNTGESFGQLRIEGGAEWTGDVILAGPITGPGDGTLGAASGTGTVSGAIREINGPQPLTKDGAGTIVFSGNNTYTGPTTIVEGTLLVNAPGSVAPASAVSVSASTRLAGNGTIHGPVNVSAGGTLAGSLTIHGPVNIAADATLDATDATLPSVNATQSLTLAGSLNMSIDRSRVPNASSLILSGNLVRGGTLRILNTGPPPQLGDSFTITISAGGLTGAFSSTLLPPLGYGLAWNTSQVSGSLVLTVVANSSFTPFTVTLTPSTTNQQIHGIGANFCLGPQSIAWSTTNFDRAFSPAGLNISFARLGNSFECAIDEPEIFWSGWDLDNVRFIQMFRAIQPDGLLTMSAWSPPGSLKSTGSANGGTLAKTGNAYRYTDYANWWLRSLQYFRDNSTLPPEKAIPDFISIQNEPDFTPSGSPSFYAAWQSGCYLNSTETSTKAGYPQALAAVKSAFQSDGFGFVKFVGPDTTTANPSVISAYLNALPANSFAAIAHHPYQGSTNNLGSNTTSIAGLRAAYPAETIYMTEFFGDDSYGSGVPDWMMHCLPLHNVLVLEKANTYLMWGLSLASGSATSCALGHYSKFINPGDWRSAASTTDPNVAVSLFRRAVAPGVPDRLALVMINKGSTHSHQTIQTSPHWTADPVRRVWRVYKTADDGSASQRLELTEDLSGAALAGNRTLVLAPYSITTVLLNSDAPLTQQEIWRQQHFGSPANLANASDNADSNNDGESNLYEFATGQNPHANSLVTPGVDPDGANIEFTYTRSKAAMADGITFTVESSETLAPGSWITATAPESVIAETSTTQTIRLTLPASSSRTFLRLRIQP